MPSTFDMALIQRGARLRRSPYFESTLRAGCRSYTVYNHMFLPTRYDDLHAEYEKLLNGVTVWDVSVERQVEITGPDAFEFTNLLTPRDLSKCAVGQGKYVLITAEDGGIVNDPVLLRLGENHFWLARGGQRCPALGEGGRPQLRARRRAVRAGRVAHAGAGSQVEGSHPQALWGRSERVALLLVRRHGPGRHSGGRDAHRMERRGRL